MQQSETSEAIDFATLMRDGVAELRANANGSEMAETAIMQKYTIMALDIEPDESFLDAWKSYDPKIRALMMGACIKVFVDLLNEQESNAEGVDGHA